MKKLLSVALFFVLALNTPVSAKPKGKPDNGVKYTIIEADALSVTASVGTADEPLKTYKINDSTKVQIDGLAANARDLKGGMVAFIKLSGDNLTAVSIDASDPKRSSKKKK